MRLAVFAVARRSPTDVTVAVEHGRVEVSGTKGTVTLADRQRTAIGRDGVPEPASALQPGDDEELRHLGDEFERAFKSLGEKLRRLFRH